MPIDLTADIETNRALQAQVIAAQNDLFRCALVNIGARRKCYECGITGNVVFSHNVSERVQLFQHAALCAVAEFSDFDEYVDPYRDHSCGVVSVWRTRLFWKIDLWDLDLDQGSDRPYDPVVTERVLTIMEPLEY